MKYNGISLEIDVEDGVGERKIHGREEDDRLREKHPYGSSAGLGDHFLSPAFLEFEGCNDGSVARFLSEVTSSTLQNHGTVTFWHEHDKRKGG